MEDDAVRLTIIVPAFNEAQRLTERASLLEHAVLNGTLDPRATELIFVDDGSTDDTGRRAEELLGETFPLLRVLRLDDNAGKGAAVRLGTAAASAPLVVFMDADMSVDPAQIPRLVSAIDSADVAIGSRSLAGSNVTAHGYQRKVMGRMFNVLVNAVTNIPFRDTQCGFKAFRTPMARILFHLMQVERFAFDVEVLSLARQLRMQITEVPVDWREVGQSTVRTVADTMSMTKDVLHLWLQRSWPQLPALSITPGVGERRRSQARIWGELRQALGSNYPILALPGDRSLVLLPLCDPIAVQGTAQRLHRLPTKLSVLERSVRFPELLDLAPFRWIEAGVEELVVPSHSNVRELVASTTLGHEWRSSHSNKERSPVSRASA